MKKFSVFPLIAALAVFVSCQKQQTEEERKAEVERQVQERLATERAAADKDALAKQQADLAAREKALADREAAAAANPSPVVEEQPAPPAEETVTETSDAESRTETRSTAAYGMFYEKLDPYGEWRETSEYGYVFQPREAESSRDWRPYTEGHWVYSDAGWTWVSDETFGWATYHYGRWVKLRRVGWVWVPGQEWAPAWVSWRSSKDYVGWAPLPPEARFDRKSGIQNWADSYYDIGPDQYSFVPSNEFGAEHVRRAVVPAERNINIVIETTNVTRITFSNAMVVNEGPSYDEFRSRGPRPIERYRLRREHNFEGPPRVSGNELQVSVPILSAVTNIFRPRRVKERMTDVNVDNGWTSVSDRSAAERARTKIRTESTPPPNAPPKKFVPPATAAASATPAPTVATTPAPPTSAATATTAPSATTPAPTAAPSATTTPVATTPPRTRPSPTIRVRATPSVAPSPVTAPTSSPKTSPNPPVATATPAAQASPSARMRPSPSIPPRTIPTPRPSASLPMVPRKTAPPVPNTPVPTAPPTDASESTTNPPLTSPPVKRLPMSPRPRLPTPTVAPQTSDTVRPPIPKDVPRRTGPPRLTPPPATTPAETPSAAQSPAPQDHPKRFDSPRFTPPTLTSPGADDRAKNRKPPRPGPENATPIPTPSTPPN
jgi:hypothetical protein